MDNEKKLKVSLWLAEMMGLSEAKIFAGMVEYVEDYVYGLRNHGEFIPFTNKAQFAECLLWAAKNNIRIVLEVDRVIADNKANGRFKPEFHDNTDASIMAATLLAIAKATGFQE